MGSATAARLCAETGAGVADRIPRLVVFAGAAAYLALVRWPREDPDEVGLDDDQDAWEPEPDRAQSRS